MTMADSIYAGETQFQNIRLRSQQIADAYGHLAVRRNFLGNVADARLATSGPCPGKAAARSAFNRTDFPAPLGP